MATVILKRCHEYDAARLQALLGEAMESLDLSAPVSYTHLTLPTIRLV